MIVAKWVNVSGVLPVCRLNVAGYSHSLALVEAGTSASGAMKQ